MNMDDQVYGKCHELVRHDLWRATYSCVDLDVMEQVTDHMAQLQQFWVGSYMNHMWDIVEHVHEHK
jgi:hypothetical protein